MSWIEQLHFADWNQVFAILVGAYILGCFTAGYYLVRWIAGKDIREVGSGSVGARNVSRVLGKTGFTLTVLCDASKGMLAVWAARHFTTDERLIILAMLAVVAGHVWPLQLRFHGGKGMATALGSLALYDPRLALAFGVLFLGLLVIFRRTILPGLFALACVPLGSMWLSNSAPRIIILLSFWAGLVLIAHRRNFIEEFAQFAARRPDQPETDQPIL